ncbi:alpha/beta fold hydrolase [Streptomyces sp. NPDC051162]|uniref:thioesterase II family protein n=1 Tax=Streptomyces sp. NPDC051162 TaxID=3154747 RepID=UPI00343E2290
MTEQNDSPWIRRFHPPAADAPRLVCFPFAGGAANCYFQLSRALSPEVEVLVIQYPGRQERLDEPCMESVQALADRIFDELSEHGLADQPLTLFGHSMGSLVAFEVALRLQGHRTTPRSLIASGSRAPSARHEGSSSFTDEELIEELRNLNGTDEKLLLNQEFMTLVLTVLRSDYRAVASYHHASNSRLSCPITVLSGDQDPLVPAATAGAWEQHTSLAFRQQVFPGGHFFLDDHVDAIRQTVREHVVPLS